MRFLSQAIADLPEFGEMLSRIQSGGTPVAVTGLGPVQRAHICAAVRVLTEKPILVLCADEEEAARLSPDLESLTGDKPIPWGPGVFFTMPRGIPAWGAPAPCGALAMSMGKGRSPCHRGRAAARPPRSCL